MEQLLLVYGLPKKAVAAIIMLNKNTKVKVRSPDGDTDVFDIVADVLQRGYILGSLNKFPDFFRMGTFIDSTHMKL